jgi:Protein of unknown function (DUF3631)
MFMTQAQAVAVVLWLATTYVYELLEIHVFLAITAPTKLCGKSTLFTLISMFVPRALVVASNASAPFLFRSIGKFKPTLMVDEAQAAFRKFPELADLYNAGHIKSTAYVGRVDKEGDELVEKLFPTFCPKVLALKGKIHDDSLQERVIEIRLARVVEGDLEDVDFWDDYNDHREIFLSCIRRFKRAVMDSVEAFKSLQPNLPKFSNGRVKQNWKPLWKFAELAGGDWCDKLEKSITECERESLREPPFTEYLLKALKEFCEEYQEKHKSEEQRDHVPTDDILSPTAGLNADREAPWFVKGDDGLTAERLGKEVRGLGVASTKKYHGEKQVRGYSFAALQRKIFKRYLIKAKVPAKEQRKGEQ